MPRFQNELREYLRTDGGIYEAIDATNDLTDEIVEKLDKALEHFKGTFNVEEERSLV